MSVLEKLSIKERVIAGSVVIGAISGAAAVLLYPHLAGFGFRWAAVLVVVTGVGLLSAGIGWWVQRDHGRQIQQVADAARKIAISGSYGDRLPTGGSDQAGRLMTAFNTLLARFQQQVSALEEAKTELESWFEESTRDLMDTNHRLKHEMNARRKTEAALAEREEQLKQSQKLEAIGRLAGGVAHDFNNQLAIIRGYLEMALDDLPSGSSVYNDLTQIARAVQRSTSLTDQLLLFSSRQPMHRRRMVLTRHLDDLQRMLGRLLGEDITFSLDLAEDLWTISADQGNIDQVLTNLSVNARDAMPNGGTLTIATRNVKIDEAYCRRHRQGRPGRFVQLSVADTGVGMTPKAMTQIFEPFYTTKGPDKGTGLGLSVVYGIVQAHKGWITVDSEVGSGTQFSIYLPAVAEEAESTEEKEEVETLARFQGNGESILLVEDEPELRTMTERALKDRGYAVQACASIGDAREAFARREPDLVLSDVVLPDGRGSDLVFDLMSGRPGTAGILVTGYTDERADWERAREKGVELLMKPVPMATLLEEVARALERRQTG